MLEVSETEIDNRMNLDNPWWTSSSGVGGSINDFPRRAYLESFHSLVLERDVSRAVVLMGPRRVGKTILVQHSIQKLLDAGTPPENVLYVSIDAPIYTGLSLEQLLRLFVTRFEHDSEALLFVFFDEIQYLPEWEVHLKSLVDSYRPYKFVVTGSAAAALKYKSHESGAGRFTDCLLPPLTFSEFLTFSNRADGLVSAVEHDNHYTFQYEDIDRLNSAFVDYLNYGGYPESVMSESIRKDASRFIRSDIIDKVLLRDLPSLYGIRDVPELNRLFTVVAYNTGQEVNLEGLSKSSGVAKNTIRRYLEYLEAAFLIRRVSRIDKCAQRFKRETYFKIYLTNPSMRAALFGDIDEGSRHMGCMAETGIFSQMLHGNPEVFYARWTGGEVDFVSFKPDLESIDVIVEVKWSDAPRENPSKLSNVLTFCRANSFEGSVTATTKSVVRSTHFETGTVLLVPCSFYAFAIGRLLSGRLIQLSSDAGQRLPMLSHEPGGRTA